MTALRRFSLVLGLALAACRPGGAPPVCDNSAVRARAEPAFVPAPLRVAVTIDDVPGCYDALAGLPKSRAIADIVSTLTAHKIAPVGFVNGDCAERDADAQAGLKTWLAAGFEVGNHSFSHQSARALAVDAFLADVERNRTFLRTFTAERPLRFFRFPYLERGKSPAERSAISEGLARAGYRVANVSVDFADWAFAPAYARCLARGDENALRALSESYLQNARAALFWAAESAQLSFGRAIAQVLLLHAHGATAKNLPLLLDAYEQAGVTWITLDEALSDAAYAEPLDRDHGDGELIAEARRLAHAPARSFVPRPLELLELVCR